MLPFVTICVAGVEAATLKWVYAAVDAGGFCGNLLASEVSDGNLMEPPQLDNV